MGTRFYPVLLLDDVVYFWMHIMVMLDHELLFYVIMVLGPSFGVQRPLGWSGILSDN